MGNQSQSLIRDDEDFNSPRGDIGGSESPKTESSAGVALPPMALMIEAVLWPAEDPSPFSTQRLDEVVKKQGVKTAPAKRQRIWCTASVDGRELGPPLAFPKPPGKRTPLKVEQRHPNSQLVLRFSREDPEKEEANKDLYGDFDNDESIDGGEPEEEDWQLNSSPGQRHASRQGKLAQIQFPLANLVRYGAPLYTTLCLGVPLDGDTPSRLDLGEALQRGQLTDSPKVTITLFRAARPRDFYDLSTNLQPDIHAALVEDLEPLPTCGSNTRPIGPTCATQIKGLTRALRLMSTVAYSLQDAHFGGVSATSERHLGDKLAQIAGVTNSVSNPAANDQIRRLEDELQISKRETIKLQADLYELDKKARLQEERLEKELARTCGELQDYKVEYQKKASEAEQVNFLSTELEHAHERVKLLSKGKEQWHYELVRKYTDLEAQHTAACAEHALMSVEHQAVQDSLKQKDAELLQKDAEIKELLKLRQAQEALQQEKLQLKADREVETHKWQKEKLELLRSSNQEKAALQSELLKKTEELEAVQQQLRLTNTQGTEQSQATIKKLQEEAQEAKRMLLVTSADLRRSQELQLENLQLRDELKSLKERENFCRQDLKDELVRNWSELQSLRQAAKERSEDMERARTDLEAWTHQHGVSDLTGSWPELPCTQPPTP